MQQVQGFHNLVVHQAPEMQAPVLNPMQVHHRMQQVGPSGVMCASTETDRQANQTYEPMCRNTYEVPVSSFGSASSHIEANSCIVNCSQAEHINYSQGEGMSYTQMLMSAETGFLQGTMEDEKKHFMITGRYSGGNDNIEEYDDAFEQQQENSMHSADISFEEETSAHQIDISTAHDTEISNGEWEDETPEYDIFGDKTANASTANPSDCTSDEPPLSTCDQAAKTSDVNPPSVSGEASNGQQQNAANVEHLSQEDIEKFIEIDGGGGEETCSQEVRRRLTTHVNMIFDSDDQAYHFYNDYAAISGFSVTKAGTYHPRKGDSSGPTRCTYVCNRAGKVVDEETMEAKKKKKEEKRQERTGVVPPENARRKRQNTIAKTGCLAKMVVSLRNGKWFVITLELEHNHGLSPPDETKHLRSHKHMTDDEKLFILTFNSVKLATRKIMAILAYLRGGVSALPYDKKYISNVRTAIRNECRHNDMTQVLEYFRKRKEDDPRFYYRFNLGEGKKVLSIFWADGNSRNMYDLYGDCVSFDTTYKTNRYNLPFAPFVGVTGHGNNCLFACAIMQDESSDCFKWLFETFDDCMGNKAPATIITDQCKSMSKAIPLVWPNTVHRYCFFHIRKKALEKCGRSFATKQNLHEDFSDILCNSLTIEEFEFEWQQMLLRYDVGNLKYFKAMWAYRKLFVPVYFKNYFFPFIHSTARSEGTNSVFKDNVGSTYSVISFLGEYQRICESTEEKERKQDSITRTTIPTYRLHTEIEYQAASIYNREIFYKFQKQLYFSTKFHVNEVAKNQRYDVYKTKMLAAKDFRQRRYVVLVNPATQDICCICCKFQKDGILCSHILRVLVNLNVLELPAKYFIDRWKPKERKTIRDNKYNIPMQLTENDRHLRFNVLSRRLADIASDGSVSNARFLMVVEEAKKLEEKLDAMALAEEKEELQKKQGHNAAQNKRVMVDDGYGESLENPDVAKPRGRPSIPGRMKSIAEIFRSKQKSTCSHCGSEGHNYATCEFKNLDKSVFQKKTTNKKSSGPTSTRKKQNAASVDEDASHKKAKGTQSPLAL